MSPTPSRPPARHAPPRLERPSLDRPSLFAGMEAGDSIVPEDDDAQRGGILSTLESVRQRKPAGPGRTGGRGGRGSASAATGSGSKAWQSKALISLMGVGIVSLMTAFVMVVRHGHPPAASPEAQLEREVLAQVSTPAAAGSSPSAMRDLNVLASPAAGVTSAASAPTAPTASTVPSTPAETAARIENTAPAARTAVAPVATPTPATPAAPVAARVAVPAAATVATAAQAPTAAASTPTRRTAAARAPTRAKADNDVALIEAMLTHANKPTGAPAAGAANAGEQIRSQCGGLHGGAAATCRARICVQHPGASACQESAP